MIFIKKIYFSELLTEWINNKYDIKIQTKENYIYLINYYLTLYFSKIKIKKMTIDIIIDFFNNINASQATKKLLLYIIKSSYRLGIDKYHCKLLDFDKIKFKKSKKIINIFTKEEQLIIENYIKSNMNIRRLAVLLCLYTGLRVGEVSGLKWEDINFSGKTLQVNRTIIRVKNKDSKDEKTKLIESSPKSESSIRPIPIPDFIINYLKQYKTNDEYYILSNSHKLYDPRYLESAYNTIIKNCHIKYVNFHTLRNTFATRSIEANVDIKTLSEILGHSSVEITLNTYVHSSSELKRNSINTLVNYMNS